MTQEASEYLDAARRWFTEGWTGNVALADELFGEALVTNGVHVGAAGPRGRILERLAGFPDLTTEIVELFAAADKVVVHLIWRGTHTGTYGGVPATGKPVEIRDSAIWRVSDGKVQEILTLQDQFGFLKQVGYLPADVVPA